MHNNWKRGRGAILEVLVNFVHGPLRLENYAQRNISFGFLLSFFPIGPFYNPQHTPPATPPGPPRVWIYVRNAASEKWKMHLHKSGAVQSNQNDVFSHFEVEGRYYTLEMRSTSKLNRKTFFPPFTRSQIVCIEFILFLI